MSHSDHRPPRRTFSEWLPLHWREIGMLAFVSLLLGVWAWWSTNTKRNDTHSIATCRSLYADARSRADTLRIDLIDPVEPNDAGSEKLTCGALRTSGQLG